MTLWLGFVNAQYRFVMHPEGDYTVHFADPDMCVHMSSCGSATVLSDSSFFHWYDIMQVIIPRSSALAPVSSTGDMSGHDEGNTSCPICLSSPTAPRMTKCGHVSSTNHSSYTIVISVSYRYSVSLAFFTT